MKLLKMLALFAALAPTERDYVTKQLAEDEVDPFFAKSDVERAAILKAAADADPVIFKGEKTGIEVRKSDGDVAKRLAEKAEMQATALEKAEAQVATEKSARELVELTKRANDTLGNLAGTDAAHVEVLRAVEAIADVTKRDAAIATLKSANAAMKSATKAKGAGGITEPVAFDKKSTYDAFEKGLKEFAQANKIDKSKLWSEAFDGFVATTEGAELHAAYNTARTVA